MGVGEDHKEMSLKNKETPDNGCNKVEDDIGKQTCR